MATAFNPQYVNLDRYEAAQIARRANQQSPLDAALQGLQQGIQLQQLPQTLQDQALQRQLANAIANQKLTDLANPQLAAQKAMQSQALEAILSGRNPNLVLQPQVAPELQAMRDVALEQAGVPAPTTDFRQVVPTLNGIPAIGLSPSAGAQAAQADIENKIKLFNARPELFRPLVTDQGVVNVGTRSNEVVPLRMPSTGENLKSPVKPVGLDKKTRFSDAQGNLFDQAVTGGAASPVVDGEGNQINVGIPNKVFFTDQGVMSAPSKSQGPPTASPLADNSGQPLTKTKTPSSTSGLVDKLYKEVQSNKSYQAFRTVNEAMEGLKATLEYAQSNPADQTGIKSSAVDAFNRIINPNSIVRQQSFNQTTTGQSLLNRAENFLTGIITGQTITPQQIQSMIDIAQSYETSSKEAAQRELRVLRNRGDKAGLDVNDYIPDLFNAPSPQSTVNSPTDPEVEAFRKKHGL